MDVAEGVVAGKYRLLFLSLKQFLKSRKWRYFIQDKCADRLKALVIN